MLAALRRGTRDTALVALTLSCFAVWGTLMRSGPFVGDTLNDSFLLLLAFIISITVPSLALAADVTVRVRAEEQLDQQIRQRTAELASAIESLQSEVEERREVDAKLEEQRVHLLEAQRLANLGSWSWDVANGRVSWSQQIYEIYGVKRAEFGGTYEDYINRVHPEDRERVGAVIANALKTGGSFRMDERIVRPSGEVRHLLSTGEVIRNERGAPVRMLGICHDITSPGVSPCRRSWSISRNASRRCARCSAVRCAAMSSSCWTCRRNSGPPKSISANSISRLSTSPSTPVTPCPKAGGSRWPPAM
jgi:PAS domain S-box-containing protein